jgi:hypothetical protein
VRHTATCPRPYKIGCSKPKCVRSASKAKSSALVFYTGLDMRDSLGLGLLVSFFLSIPIGIFELLIVSVAVGDWVLWLFFPYLAYFTFAIALVYAGHPRMRVGLVIGGMILSTLILVGILFFSGRVGFAG